MASLLRWPEAWASTSIVKPPIRSPRWFIGRSSSSSLTAGLVLTAKLAHIERSSVTTSDMDLPTCSVTDLVRSMVSWCSLFSSTRSSVEGCASELMIEVVAPCKMAIALSALATEACWSYTLAFMAEKSLSLFVTNFGCLGSTEGV